MKHFSFTLLIILFLMNGSTAQELGNEECFLHPDSLVPVIDATSSTLQEGSYVQDLQVDELLIKENMTLKNGMEIAYEMGGCVHYSYSFTFSSVPDALKTADNLPAMVAHLLTHLPLSADKKTEITDVAAQIRQTVIAPESQTEQILWVSCGDAICSIDVERWNQDGVLHFFYDFPL